MEENKDYLAISEFISNLERQLRLVEEAQLRDLEKSRRQIEEHFERCIHALEVRQQTLLSQLRIVATQETTVSDPTVKILDMLQSCNAMKETGALVYKTDHSIAEQIWQGANKLVMPNTEITSCEIEIDLPEFLLESIANFGTIAKKDNVEDTISTISSPILPSPSRSPRSPPSLPLPVVSASSSSNRSPENPPQKSKITRTNGSFLHVPESISTLTTASSSSLSYAVEFSPQKSPTLKERPESIPLAPKEPEIVNLAPFKIVLIGGSHVGKTSIARRFTHNTFSAASKSSIGIEFDTAKLDVDVGKQRAFQIWSPAGTFH
eukprot:Phypoly_transcript_06103.p1 GENE.Phypoly_transcript_06103~~Phypoly_transcript_06103.p1  ORF type:complete len:321 (+),score=57.00 Phypoly_transcript_06103:384-1346(+)